jgi:16S rRNA (guanine(966)-N(2))-methyltransferase RsmD
MRIISGIHKGRNIAVPHSFTARPTTDFAKVALFNILAGHFDFAETEALDIFAGSGSISYEFASRGCRSVDCVENNGKYRAFIQQTARTMGLQQIHCYMQDAFAYLNSCRKQYDIIFADPPYNSGSAERIPDIVFEKALLKADGWLILEHSSRIKFETNVHFLQSRRYGSVNFSIFGL